MREFPIFEQRKKLIQLLREQIDEEHLKFKQDINFDLDGIQLVSKKDSGQITFRFPPKIITQEEFERLKNDPKYQIDKDLNFVPTAGPNKPRSYDFQIKFVGGFHEPSKIYKHSSHTLTFPVPRFGLQPALCDAIAESAMTWWESKCLKNKLKQIKHDHLERYDVLTRHLLKDLAKLVMSYI